jgi:hypothetical protein
MLKSKVTLGTEEPSPMSEEENSEEFTAQNLTVEHEGWVVVDYWCCCLQAA